MSNIVNLGEVEQLVAQLPPLEKLKLVSHICEELSIMTTESEVEQVKLARLQLAEELLTECSDIEDDSKGKFDATKDVQRMRERRVQQICQSDV